MKKENIQFIIIHCSATRSNMNYPAFQLDRDHRARGMRCAGYHYYITKDGEIHELRPITEMGAHCRGYNDKSIGICYEGGITPRGEFADTRTSEQIKSMRQLITILKNKIPRATIVGHRDLSPDINRDGVIEQEEWIKACPCFDAMKYYADFNKNTK